MNINNRSAHLPFTHRALGAMLLVAIIACCIRVALCPAYDGLDDVAYLSAANALTEGRAFNDIAFPLYRYRIGLSFPLAGLSYIGVLPVAKYWVLTVLLDCGSLLLLALGCARLFGSRTGVIAAMLWAIYPMTATQSATYMPTAFQGFFICAAFYFFAVATTRQVKFSSFGLAYLSGLMLGLGYLTKEDTALLVVISFVSGILCCPQLWRLWFSMAAGAATVFMGECLTYFLVFDDPLARFAAVSGEAYEMPGHIAALWKWNAYLKQLFLVPYQVGLYWWLLPFAIYFGMRAKSRAMNALLVIFAISLCWLQFGTVSFAHYEPLPRGPRYTILVTPVLIAILAYWLSSVYQSHRKVFYGICSVLAVSSITCIIAMGIKLGERTRNTPTLLVQLDKLGIHDLHTDFYSARLINILASHNTNVHVLYHADYDAARAVGERPHVQLWTTELAGRYVWIDYQQSKVYTSSYEIPLPDLIARPPPEWQVVWRTQAYSGFSRAALQFVGRLGQLLPSPSLRSGVKRAIDDILLDDGAVLYKIPEGWKLEGQLVE